MLFEKNSVIGDYTVLFQIKCSFYAETYRVVSKDKRLCFLKLICNSKLRPDQLDDRGRIKELSFVRAVKHRNLCRFIDSGQLEKNGEQYTYYVMSFVSSETVEERLQRERFNTNDVKTMTCALLHALAALHTNTRCILHNDVTAHNVLYNLMGRPNDILLVDFGSASYASDKLEMPDIETTNPFYMAPERLMGKCSVESDLFSVGVFLYHTLFGHLPWYVNLEDILVEKRVDVINECRRGALLLPETKMAGLDEQLTNIIVKALQFDPAYRFHSAKEFIEAIENKSIVKKQPTEIVRGRMTGKCGQRYTPQIKIGNGFADVAGMEDLKAQLRSDVIDVLHDRERAKSLGIAIPNGILFYGPPGCGKTYFAEKFAEEVGCNYIYVKCSDVASPYIHGGQGNIAAIFDEARAKAPSIVFLDEIDALLMHRSKHNNPSESGEVNEFLVQMNNCGSHNVLVIGATNKPDEIDEAALRAGRLEMKYYVPLPDIETRELMLKLELSKRKSNPMINCRGLSVLMEGYSCADIKLLVDNAARIVFRHKLTEITEQDIDEAMKQLEPSLSKAALMEFMAAKQRFENNGDYNYRTVGFNKN